MIFSFLRQHLFSVVLSVASLVFSSLTHALPVATNVPGGIALIKLAPSTHGTTAPHAFLGEQPVWVVSESGYWTAVIGLALDTSPGTYQLRLGNSKEEKTIPFKVNAKHYPEQRITLKDSSRVTLSAENEARAEKEIAVIQGLKKHWREATDTDSDFLLPAPGRLASRFGLRRFFNGEPRAPHSGLDIAVARGTSLKAAAHGQILNVDDYFFNGKTVFVDHGNGLISMYCHLDRIDVQTGDTVAKGQHLGLSGMTGRASGPHLHWGVILNGVMVDPALFIATAK
ncbi:MAG: peptidoglycan DD-metalloendopeptidase family protein [Betaproteobacteria bacterium]